MKLYCDPISTTSRPVMMLATELGLELELVNVDLMGGGNQAPDYLALNPNGIVPFLVDGDFRLGESAAILKYLALKADSGLYPAEPQAQARVDEAISWFSTQFHEYFCIMVCYPNIGVPHGAPPELMQGLKAYGYEHAPRWLKVLDGHILAGRDYVAGDEASIADFLGLSFCLLGGLDGYDFSPYPNIQAWISRMQARPAYGPTYAAFGMMVEFFRNQQAAAA
jgi:glutathione S-transferase